MKTKVIVNVRLDKFGVDSKNVNDFLTKNEKNIIREFFRNYINKFHSEHFETQETLMKNKVSELIDLGFEPIVKEEVIYHPLNHIGNLEINYGYIITWTNNLWKSSSENLASHYSFKTAFYNDKCSKQEMDLASDIEKIINRAISYSQLIEDLKKLQKKNKELNELVDSLKASNEDEVN